MSSDIVVPVFLTSVAGAGRAALALGLASMLSEWSFVVGAGAGARTELRSNGFEAMGPPDLIAGVEVRPELRSNASPNGTPKFSFVALLFFPAASLTILGMG